MDETGSVSIWIRRLKSGEARDAAVSNLWRRYFNKLVSRARDRLRARSAAVDGEDIALAAFDSFVRAAEAGKLPCLDDRDELWKLLLGMTINKSCNVMRDEMRLKRGGGKAAVGIGGDEEFDLASEEPDPAETLALAEEADRLLRELGDDELRKIAVWALEGYTNLEIAGNLGKSVATAERKLRHIRHIWTSQLSVLQAPTE